MTVQELIDLLSEYHKNYKVGVYWHNDILYRYKAFNKSILDVDLDDENKELYLYIGKNYDDTGVFPIVE